MTDAVRESGEPVIAYIGLGSNIGDKARNVAEAIRRLVESGEITLMRRSRDFRTAPWGVTDQDWFVNACIAVSTRLSARDLLARCLAVERAMGRVREVRWGPRLIDLDLLIYGAARIDEPDLQVPHPQLAARAFVLAPLVDIAPDLIIDGRTVREQLMRIDARGVEPTDKTATAWSRPP